MSNKPQISWTDRFALIDHYSPADKQICKSFQVTQNELDTARKMRSAGTFSTSKNLDVSKYSNFFVPVDSTKPLGDNTTTHIRPESASKKETSPQKRGRKGNNIQAALNAVPAIPVDVNLFMQQHNVSLAVLRQSKRFLEKMDATMSKKIGHVNVKKDKTTKSLMIWRSDN